MSVGCGPPIHVQGWHARWHRSCVIDLTLRGCVGFAVYALAYGRKCPIAGRSCSILVGRCRCSWLSIHRNMIWWVGRDPGALLPANCTFSGRISAGKCANLLASALGTERAMLGRSTSAAPGCDRTPERAQRNFGRCQLLSERLFSATYSREARQSESEDRETPLATPRLR